MARTNVAIPFTAKTYEGAPATRVSNEQQLRRLVMANMLWEDQFYVDGKTTAQIIRDVVFSLPAATVANIAIEARKDMKLRHIPLLLARELARHPKPSERQVVANLLYVIIDRPDELAEFVSIYWQDGKQPLSNQVKKGLARAFSKFSEYQFAKWQKPDAAIKLRDVLFLSHAKPTDAEQEDVFKRVVEQTLITPDTWEVELSGGKGENKKESWERLLTENKLGALALLRNLRNMTQQGVSPSLVRDALQKMKTERVLPFRFITAARYAPSMEDVLEQAMFRCLTDHNRLPGKTALLVDVSGSMISNVSGKSELTRLDAAVGLAMLLREVCEEVKIGTFNRDVRWCRPRRGFALRDEIGRANGGTDTGKAVREAAAEGYDRIIVLTDEQSQTPVGNPLSGKRGYMINVAAYHNGVGTGAWNKIDGWSEAVVAYLLALEKEPA